MRPASGPGGGHGARLAPAVADALRSAARRHRTPLHVLDLAALDAAAEELRAAFPDPWLRHYRLVSNPLPIVLERLARHGFGARVGSIAEWHLATAAGLPNDRIVLAGRGKGDAELRAAVEAAAAGRPLLWVTVESESEADALEALAVRGGLSSASAPERRVDGVLRLRSPGVDDPSERVLARARPTSAVRWRGFALGDTAPIQTIDPWRDLVRRSLALLALLGGTVDTLDTLDVGGGLPVHSDLAPAPDPVMLAAEIGPLLEGLPADRRPARLAVEAGPVAVAPAGWLVARVLHVEERRLPPLDASPSPTRAAVAAVTRRVAGAPRGRRRRDGGLRVVAPGERTTAPVLERRIGIDAGLVDLATDALGEPHPVVALTSLRRPVTTGRFDEVERTPATVVGRSGAAGDSFGEHALPALERGDLVAIGLAGAHVAAVSPVEGHGPPPELVLDVSGRLGAPRPGQR